MTLLLYEYHELEERASQHLRAWKVWHILLFILAAICGILNYVFLQSSMQLIENNCILYPRYLEFQEVDINVIDNAKFDYFSSTKPPNMEYGNAPILKKEDSKTPNGTEIDNKSEDAKNVTSDVSEDKNENVTSDVSEDKNENDTRDVEEKAKTVKREAEGKIVYFNETKVAMNNATVITDNMTLHIMLDTERSVYGKEGTCQFAEYMPLLSAVFAIVWATLFIMCPGGGRPESSAFYQPWRILTPALLFALVLVALTGYSFTSTNGGLQDFCASFHNVTNATTCSSVNEHLRRGLNASWGLGARVEATRAAAAGAWVSWACAAALLMARCLAAPDFVVTNHKAFLRDPAQKITPRLPRSPGKQRSTQSSPSKRDNASLKSIPTLTTEVVTASVEQPPVDSEATSLTSSPVRLDHGMGEAIELTDNPQSNGQR